MNFKQLNEKIETIFKNYKKEKAQATIKELEDLAKSTDLNVENIDEYKDDWKIYNKLQDWSKPKLLEMIEKENINVNEIHDMMNIFNISKANINQLNGAVMQIRQELIKKINALEAQIEEEKRRADLQKRQAELKKDSAN